MPQATARDMQSGSCDDGAGMVVMGVVDVFFSYKDEKKTHPPHP